MYEGQVPPSTATVLSLGKYTQKNGEHVVEVPTMAKLYTMCNPVDILSLAFERAVLGNNLPEFTWEIVEDVSVIPNGKRYVDIETSGDINAHIPNWDYIISMSITVNGHTYVLPEEFIQNNRNNIQEMLRKSQSIIMHNGKFDSGYLNVPQDEDTMLKHYALFPNSIHGLKELGKMYLGMEDWDTPAKKYLGKLKAPVKKELAEILKVAPKGSLHTGDGAYIQTGVEYTASNGYERIPRTMLYEYNAMDTYVTWLLDELLDNRWFMQEGYDYARTTYEMLLQYNEMFADIESHGVRFDVPYMEQLSVDLTRQKEMLEEKLNKLAGKEVNPRSPQQVKAMLHENGIRVDSTSVGVLEQFEGDPIVDTVLEIRGVTKNLGTYIDGFLKQMIGDRAYPSFKIATSTTGRLGGGGASLLTIPRDKMLKRMVLPDEGHVMLGVDLSQAELRVMACESGDEGLIEKFAPDAGDFFDSLLEQAHGKPVDRNDPEYVSLRTSMKSVVYGASFSRGLKAISQELGIPHDEAKTLHEAFIVPGSDFDLWRDEVLRKAVNAEPIMTRYGRLYENQAVMFYTSGNIGRTGQSFISQATANDITLQTAYRIWESDILKRRYNARIVSTLHDAVYVSVPEEHAEEVGKLVQDTFTLVARELYGDTVPFESEMGYGETFADA